MKMLLRVRLIVSSLLLGLIAMSSCGGSASETPWPTEPESPALGPSGETGPTSEELDTPDAGEITVDSGS